jgi:hypothetical protein
MLLANWLAALIDLIRRSRTSAAALPPEMLHCSLPELAGAALKPGTQTWLVARAVSLRAF